MKETCCSLQAHVLEAHALGGKKMYEVKVACKGKTTAMTKSKEDFKNVINMFKLLGAMSRNQADRCEVCAACSALTQSVRVLDEDTLDAFLSAVLAKLRQAQPSAIEKCSTQRGVIQILMDFLNVRHGKYFCVLTPDMEPAQDELSPSNNLRPEDSDADHPIARCSLNRTLSQTFASMDSVC